LQLTRIGNNGIYTKLAAGKVIIPLPKLLKSFDHKILHAAVSQLPAGLWIDGLPALGLREQP
jgi:hypothetical protein